MSLTVCIPDLIEQGQIPKAKARAIRSRYDRMVAQREGEMGRAAAEADATERLLAILESEASEAKRRAALQAKAQTDWLERHKAASGDGPMSVGAMKQELERSEYRIETVYSHMMVEFDEFLSRHRRNMAGMLRKRADLRDIVRARFGEKVDNDSAREVADAMGRTMEMARQRRNRAGGNTGKLDKYGLPQSHDAAAVRAVPVDEWMAFEPVQRAQVLDTETGAFASGARREEILRAAYENIRTDGGEAMVPGSVGTGSLARRRQDARVIHFENADDWLAYAEKFGGGDNAYDVFLGHMKAMAREIVLTEDMGPNPAATLRFRQDWLEKSIKTARGGKPSLIGSVRLKRDSLQRRFDTISGVANIPDSERIAKIFAAWRAQQVAAKLGGATIAAVGDLGTALHRAGFNRLPIARMAKSYGEFVADLGGHSAQQAVRLGLVTDEYLGLHGAAFRLTGEEMAEEVTRRMADGVLRASVLNRHTRAAQWAFTRETMGYLTDARHTGFDELPGPIQRMMRKYGIEAREWDQYRATPTIRDGEAEWIVPAYAGEVGERFGVMLRNERDLAVLMPDLRTRAMLAQLKPGSLAGEALRMAMMFKSFPLTMLSRHIPEMLAQPGVWNKAIYGVSLIGVLLPFGAVTMQMNEVRKGRDPRRMWGEDGPDAGFWAQAFIQSGGLGIAGDLIKSGENEYGGGLAETLAGPAVQSVSAVNKAVVGNATRWWNDEETHLGRDLTRIAWREMPGSSLWYTRAAIERLLIDRVQEWMDPEGAAKSWKRMKRFAQEQGTDYWWEPGAGDWAERGPDWGNAVDEGG